MGAYNKCKKLEYDEKAHQHESTHWGNGECELFSSDCSDLNCVCMCEYMVSGECGRG
jgi:hypothetical protein